MSSILIDIPDSLRESIEQLAVASGVPALEVAERALSDGINRQLRMAKFERLAQEVSDQDILDMLALVPDVPPDLGDELPEELRARLK
jgi:hypothetical protein